MLLFGHSFFVSFTMVVQNKTDKEKALFFFFYVHWPLKSTNTAFHPQLHRADDAAGSLQANPLKVACQRMYATLALYHLTLSCTAAAAS